MNSSVSRRALFALLLLPAFVPVLAATTNNPARWEKDIAALEKNDATNPPPQGAVLFIGSSSVRLWKTLAQDFSEYKVINRGFGGSEISDSVFFADRIVVPYRPAMIVLHAGNNDLNSGKTPERVFEDFKDFVAKVRTKLPDVRIAFLSINPSPKRAAQMEKQKKANGLIREFIATATNMDYIDIFDALLGPDGQPREDLSAPDKLHANAEGYKIRAAIVRPHLEWMKSSAAPK